MVSTLVPQSNSRLVSIAGSGWLEWFGGKIHVGSRAAGPREWTYLLPAAIRRVCWHQGDSNNHRYTPSEGGNQRFREIDGGLNRPPHRYAVCAIVRNDWIGS